MSIENLKKRVHPDANKNLSQTQISFWYFFIAYPFFLFTIIAGISMVVLFGNSDNKSISLSNYGFAMLVALASVCFSYAKSIESAGYIRLHLDIQKCAEFFLVSAIAFAISSALKYSYLEMSTNKIFRDWYGEIVKMAYRLSFLAAEGCCFYGLAKLIDVLHIRLTTKNGANKD